MALTTVSEVKSNTLRHNFTTFTAFFSVYTVVNPRTGYPQKPVNQGFQFSNNEPNILRCAELKNKQKLDVSSEGPSTRVSSRDREKIT
jgi:hypothetical protein